MHLLPISPPRFHRSTKISSQPVSSTPAKVTRTALQNAASIAGLMLTTEAMIADIQDEKGEAGGMGGGMGGMGMGM